MASLPRRGSREYFCRHVKERFPTGSGGLPGGGNTPKAPGVLEAGFYSVAQADVKITV